MALRFVETPQAIIAVEEHGPEAGPVVFLLHGFPYSARGYDAVAALMAEAGHRVLVPHLRGYGETRLKPGVIRSGGQGALGADLLALMDAMAIPSAILAGYDWGGRAACIVAALHPERCSGLVSCTGYNIQDIARSGEPAAPDREMRHWYQYYFHGARGARGLEQNRREIGRLLWEQWSPDWRFSAAEFVASAAHWENEDYVPVVIQSYRHRFGLAAGDPAHDAIEAALAQLPPITVPAIDLHGGSDGVSPPPPRASSRFTGRFERRILPGVGHNPPQEAPEEFVRALKDVAAA
ncbi:alpha/beta hydrolase [Roseococcus sp. SYP-B2431]|uniref:alpha/beta fold hydrolase n=1 Tax=Roseococcus sp. SYP-B2431 TaxID=2496640 RepID=UPI00103B1112|nr:alpha/beta hydrolase [Roseococcus sp. SYP-B2431]TCH96412.1 alpha/beta hydrolase [Roseococcus sp. SYP-B2431]